MDYSAKNKTSFWGMDTFRLLAALMVIAIHTSPLATLTNTGDFILTRIISRLAVPYFLMLTGYFVLPRCMDRGGWKKCRTYIGKIALLYVASILLYLPVCLYSGYFRELTPTGLLRDLLIDGTMYHLWYFPGVIAGLFLTVLLLRTLGKRRTAVLVILLYIIGLLGDSYYGLIRNIDFMESFYERIFTVSTYTRNGLFYIPLFLVLGYFCRRKSFCRSRIFQRPALLFFIAFSLLLTEGLILHLLDIQRHDSMYLLLPAAVLTSFLWILSRKKQSLPAVRSLATLVYILHPLVIVLVRGMGKIPMLFYLFVENSLTHFLLVCLGSLLLSAVILRLHRLGMQRLKKYRQKANRSWAEISMDNLLHNYHLLQSHMPPGCRFMAVIKANAYGHGDLAVGKALMKEGCTSFAVASAEEAVRLRRHGLRGEILVLGYTHPDAFKYLRFYRLTQTVIDSEYGKLLNGYGKKLRVQVKIDTGMNRLGENRDSFEKLAAIYRLPNLNIRGTFSHLCVCDSLDEESINFSRQQIEDFRITLKRLHEGGCDPGPAHIQSSYGLLHYPNEQFDYARIGIALYGSLSREAALPGEASSNEIGLKPVLSLKSRIVLLKQIAPGSSVSYGRNYRADSERVIAAVPLGYADGLPRCLKNGQALVNGCTAPIIGNICMDQCLIDVTGIPCRVHDTVTFIGRDGAFEITAESTAEKSGTITNELFTGIGPRIKRIYN